MTCLSVISDSLQKFYTTQDFNNAEYDEMAAALIKFEPKCNPKQWEAPVC